MPSSAHRSSSVSPAPQQPDGDENSPHGSPVTTTTTTTAAPGHSPPAYDRLLLRASTRGDESRLSGRGLGAKTNNGGDLSLTPSGGSAADGDDSKKNGQVLEMEEIGKEKQEEGGKEEEEEEKEEVPPKVGFLEIFRFASFGDVLLILCGAVAAVLGGCSMPVMIVLFGDLANAFVANDVDEQQVCEAAPQCCDEQNNLNFELESCDVDPELLNSFEQPGDFFEEIKRFGAGTSLIGLVNLVMSYIFVTCLNTAAENQVFRIRGRFLRAVLRQDIAWYDTRQTSDFAARMTEDLNKLQEGIGEKIGMFLFFATIFAASLGNAFTHGWELTLVILSAMPVLMAATGVIAKSQTALTEKELSAYSRAGATAEEALAAVRTVVAFGGQDKEVHRYESKLVFARKAGIMRGALTGIGGGLMWLIIYSSYALAFWYGVKLIMDDRERCLEVIAEGGSECNVRYDPSNLLIVFFSVLMGAMNVGQATPYVEAFSMARAAAAAIFAVVDRRPDIDSASNHGKEPAFHEGPARITLRDVHFNYPSRKKVKVLQGLSLTIEKGETVALVGPSGCGKSTVIQLIQRFYDPDSGSVELEGDDLKILNLGKLRDRIGIVGQEPILFGCSIAENVRYGRADATDEEVEQACRAANAHAFVQRLPKRYNTQVGERGAQLSGGQKQRIAIARALIRNPSILLLDEATSALDTQSEAVVQAALDKAREGRTTVVVAHRLSTIRTADKIVAIRDGRVEEVGSHEELMKVKGLYHSLVTAQMTAREDENEEDEREDTVAELEDVEQHMHSMVSVGGGSEIGADEPMSGEFSGRGSLRRKKLERKISVMSTVSEDSLTLEDAMASVGSAVGLSRVGSVRKSLKQRGLSTQESTTVAEEEELAAPSASRVLRTNWPEWPYMAVGLLSSVVMGASMPVYAVLFGEVMGILADPVDEARDKSVLYAVLFVGVGVVVGLAMFLQILMFTIAGEHLTLRMRRLAFQAMLRQEIGWFDEAANSTGALCARLSADAAAIQGMSGSRLGAVTQAVWSILLAVSAGIFHEWKLGLVGSVFVPLVLVASWCQAKIIASHDNLEKDVLEKAAQATGNRIGVILQAVFTLVTSVALSLYYDWRLGLVTASFVPLVLAAVYFQSLIIAGHDTVEKRALEVSAKIAIEAITNIRTVAGLRREETFASGYVSALSAPHSAAKRKSHLRGLVFGFAQSVPFFAYAACMYYGGYLVDNDGLEYEKVFKVAEALILGTMMVGQATAFAPNYNKAVAAAARIFKLLDRQSKIDSTGAAGLKLPSVEGNVEFKSAGFKYPTRQVRVLRDLSLAIEAGQKVALVGPSGCGKSTCIQLLQRFYDLQSGELTLEGQNLEGLNVPQVRSRLGIVSQEPVLFDRSLADNIRYGDNERDVSMDEVVAAAKKANIHHFIAALPKGYDTKVGEKGTQLSGGQKQRVAIARALVRNPAILLLDEATSALDTESEKVVQEALDAAQEGRTCVSIAHRLSTVQRADRIFVVSHGRVVERGSHQQLVAIPGGVYAKMWNRQGRGR